jgi:hypothetical protein
VFLEFFNEKPGLYRRAVIACVCITELGTVPNIQEKYIGTPLAEIKASGTH